MSNDISELTLRQQATQRLVHESEKEAQEKIAATRNRIKQNIEQEEAKLSQVKDEYVRQTEAERVRQAAALENAKAKGYENIRQAKRMLGQESHKTRVEGERDLDRVSNHYRDSIYAKTRDGEKALDELRHNYYLASEAERAKGEDVVGMARQDHTAQVTQVKQEQDAALAKLTADAKTHYETKREQTEDATRLTERRLTEKFTENLKRQNRELAAAEHRALHQLSQLTMDHARKLAAYDDRASDPFYQLVQLGAEVEEQEGLFVIKARIPEHEREGLSVTVKGNSLVISGTRRNAETLATESGGTQSTTSYQTFSETLPLGWPVEARYLTREYDGDMLVVRVPKKAVADAPQFKPTAQKTEAQRPRFPDNLPLEKFTANVAESVAQTERNKPDRPLG